MALQWYCYQAHTGFYCFWLSAALYFHPAFLVFPCWNWYQVQHLECPLSVWWERTTSRKPHRCSQSQLITKGHHIRHWGAQLSQHYSDAMTQVRVCVFSVRLVHFQRWEMQKFKPLWIFLWVISLCSISHISQISDLTMITHQCYRVCCSCSKIFLFVVMLTTGCKCQKRCIFKQGLTNT